jgi:group II intron reverse transcriptase/maturase
MAEAQDSVDVFTQRQRIARLAKQSPNMAFTSLNHLLHRHTLQEAYAQTRKDGAVGVDGQNGADYEANLQENLRTLLERAKSGTYRAPPVRRTYIPKEGATGEKRPLGIPTFEDKVLQRAVVNVLERIYEQDFHDCSYGFRPGRSAHQALQSLWKSVMESGGGWILDVDIRKFFDTLDHGVMRQLLAKRVRDGVFLRLIGKWLNAGVLESGAITYPEEGSPQGGVISPMLSNIYLHYVLDEWFEKQVKPCLRGKAFLIRYADDFVMVFAVEEDARRVLEVLPKRFAKHGLTIHPEKTRLVSFQPPKENDSKGPSGPGAFDFLGFTHYWGKSRKGAWVVKRKTSKSRLRRAIAKMTQWCKRHRHRAIPRQHDKLSRKLLGHYAYYGMTGNYDSLNMLYYAVVLMWRNWLSRRSQRGQFPWDQFQRLLRRLPLPAPRVVHSVYRAHAKP